MSRSLRPIREEWGPHTSCFVEDAVNMLRILAEELAQCPVTDYGWSDEREAFTLGIQKAQSFLDYFAEHSSATIELKLESFLKSSGRNHAPDDLEALLTNLRHIALTGVWRDWIGEGDILTLVIDG